jgi:hypothetical protein
VDAVAWAAAGKPQPTARMITMTVSGRRIVPGTRVLANRHIVASCSPPHSPSDQQDDHAVSG